MDWRGRPRHFVSAKVLWSAIVCVAVVGATLSGSRPGARELPLR